MSTRLDLALRELADAAGDTSGFGGPDTPGTVLTVQRLTARVRRRRTTRAAGSALVAASAVGAVALVTPLLTQEVAPAGDPDAHPGACHSSVTRLPAGPGDALDVALGARGPVTWPTGTTDTATGSTGRWQGRAVETGTRDTVRSHVGAPGSGTHLGTWQGRSAGLLVNVAQIPDAGVGGMRLRLLVTQDGVVRSATQEAVAVEPVPTADLLSSRLGVDDPSTTDQSVMHPLEEDPARWWEVAQTPSGAARVVQSLDLRLAACDGSGRLPVGTYQVYATTVDEVGTARGASGPWDVEIAAVGAPVSDLPDGFPREVPLITGRLADAQRQGTGWRAEVVTPGRDRATLAARLLAPAALRVDGAQAADQATDPGGGPAGDPDPGAGADREVAPGLDQARTRLGLPANVLVSDQGVELPGWAVRAVASRTPDGHESVVYVLTRRP